MENNKVGLYVVLALALVVLGIVGCDALDVYFKVQLMSKGYVIHTGNGSTAMPSVTYTKDLQP